MTYLIFIKLFKCTHFILIDHFLFITGNAFIAGLLLVMQKH